MKKISFCIPCYRSEKTIQAVIDEIDFQMAQHSDYSYEIVCVVDGSPDHVLDVLISLCHTKSYLKVINFTKNFGQASARMATLRFATGDFLVCLDDDGQCPIDHVFDLLRPLEADADVSMLNILEKNRALSKILAVKLTKK